jgi:hypothetical protein
VETVHCHMDCPFPVLFHEELKYGDSRAWGYCLDTSTSHTSLGPSKKYRTHISSIKPENYRDFAHWWAGHLFPDVSLFSSTFMTSRNTANKRMSQTHTFLCAKPSLPPMRVTQQRRALLEKLIVSQLVKKFPAFYRTRRFITVFTRARH